jgi:hypothetical protein
VARGSRQALALVGLLLTACGGGAATSGVPFAAEGPKVLDLRLCDPSTVVFTTDVTNQYFPLPVGHRLVLQGREDGESLVVRISVIDDVEEVAGVETRIVEEREEEGGRLVEVSRNFFAQAADGTVCFFGETVDTFSADGSVAGHGGSWRAGEGSNKPGIMMPAKPAVGQRYAQESAPGIAEDQGEVVALGESTAVPADTFADTVRVIDSNPLDGSRDTKVYARGVGLIVDGPARLTSR